MNPQKRTLALLTFVFASVAAATTYTDKTYNFSVTPPVGWTQGSVKGVAVIFGSPTTQGGFRPNLNVAVEDLPSEVSLEDYGKAGDAQFVKAIPDAKKIGTRRTRMGGYPAISQVVVGSVQGHQLYFTQTFAIVGKRAYVLTGTTTPDRSRLLTPQMTAFVRSFRVLK